MRQNADVGRTRRLRHDDEARALLGFERGAEALISVEN
jgi:hypothetical protein